MEHSPSWLPPLIVDEAQEILRRVRVDDQAAVTVRVDELLAELVRQGRRPDVVASTVRVPFETWQYSNLGRPEETSVEDQPVEPEPVYWFCNSCGEEVEDEAAECCVDGEIEPSYDEPAT